MATIELNDANQTGDLTKIVLNGTTADKDLLIRSVIEALINGKFGNYSFDGDKLFSGIMQMRFQDFVNRITLVTNKEDIDNSLTLDMLPTINQISLQVSINGESTGIYITNNEVRLRGITIAEIDAAVTESLLTKEWVQARAKLNDVIAGTNITIDKTNPTAPIINATGGGGTGSSIYQTVEGNNSAAIEVALAAGNEIFFPAGSYDIDTDITIDPGKSLKFAEGAILSGVGILKGNKTFIDAGQWQIFDKDLTVIGNKVVDKESYQRNYGGVQATSEPSMGDWNQNATGTIIRINFIDTNGYNRRDELLKYGNGLRFHVTQTGSTSNSFLFTNSTTMTIRANCIELAVTQSTVGGTIDLTDKCNLSVTDIPILTRWIYNAANVEWFGAGNGSLTGSNDAAGIQRTLDVFLKGCVSNGSKYWIEKTIIFSNNCQWTSSMLSIYSGINTMHDTLFNNVGANFYITGGIWTHPNFSDMSGGQRSDAYTNWIWYWELDDYINNQDFRESSYVRDVKFISGYSDGLTNFNHKPFHASGWKIKVGDNNQNGKNYFSTIDNVYIGWLNEAMDIDGWRSDLMPGQSGGQVNTWSFNNCTIDNNYKGITIRNRATMHTFANVKLQPKNVAVVSAASNGTNTAGVFTIPGKDETSIYLPDTYCRMDPFNAYSVYAWCTGSIFTGGNTEVTLVADRTRGYQSGGTYTQITAQFGAYPLMEFHSNHNVVSGVDWDLWFEDSFVYESGSDFNELNTMGFPKLERFIWDKNAHPTANNFQQDHWFKNVTGLGDSYNGHIVNRPEVKQLRMNANITDVPNIVGIEKDSLVLGKELVFWSGIGETASDGLLRYWDGNLGGYASNRIGIKTGEPLKLLDDVRVSGSVMSDSTTGFADPYYDAVGTGKGIGSGEAVGAFTTYPFTMFAEGFSRVGGTKNIIAIAGTANNALWIEIQSNKLRMSRRNDSSGSGSTTGASTSSSVDIMAEYGGYFQVFAIVRSDSVADLWVNGVYTQITWADPVDEVTFADLNILTGRTSGFQQWDGWIKRAGWWERETTFAEMASIMTAKDVVPFRGATPYCWLGESRAAGIWSDSSGNGRDSTLTNLSLIQ